MAEGTSLASTPTWAVATVITVMVSLGFFFHGSLKQLGKWLNKTKRKALLLALEKIKEELMLFGLLSLLMGHWITFVAKICVKSTALSSRFYPCAVKDDPSAGEHTLVSMSDYANTSFGRELYSQQHKYCPEGHESFASHESLEQLHRLLFVLGITHVLYSFIAIALAMIKIYSWRTWENQANTIAVQSVQGSPEAASQDRRMKRISTFIFHQTSHPWSQQRVFVWLLCFIRQFWSSINQADYMALRFGFITTHQLPLTYDFHKYMLRSMEEEFRDIVGISVPLWIYAILCIFLDFHGTELYFWLSFTPAILVLVIGTKLHRVVVKLAVEITDSSQRSGNEKFNLRDDLFWFGKPRLLLRSIQLISFQNAFEMATFLWSLWEIRNSSCFMENTRFMAIRLTFGVVSQVWCSFITFPLYVIITQMGSRFKKTVVSEDIRKSLHGWQRRVKARQRSSSPPLLAMLTPSSDATMETRHGTTDSAQRSEEGRTSKAMDTSSLHKESSSISNEISPGDEIIECPPDPGYCDDRFSDGDEEEDHDQNLKTIVHT